MLFKEKNDIEKWLNIYGIQNYRLIAHKDYGYVVNVDSSVDLVYSNITEIKIKFNEIKGNFNCSGNLLTSLKGCPEIVRGNFACSNNQLESLESSAKIVDGSFYCGYNKLISLKGCPKIINENFECSYNNLISLQYGPEIVNKYYYCGNNNLTIDGLKY